MTAVNSFPAPHELPLPTSELPPLPERDPATHKGNSGHVAIVGGSVGMSGAVVLTGLGALRAGAGLVRAYCPQAIQPLVASGEPSLMTAPLPESPTGDLAERAWDHLQETALDWAHAFALGPGFGTAQHTAKLLDRLLRGIAAPIVLDADGLNLTCAQPEALLARTDRETILTPHPGEMQRLLEAFGLPKMENTLSTDATAAMRDALRERHGADPVTAALPPAHQRYDLPRLQAAVGLARKTGAVVLLKGFRTVVASADQALINTTGNPGMATGGMGDVLTGIIAALRAAGGASGKPDGFAAACLGAAVHGLAADYCADRIGKRGYLAREVADMVPSALDDTTRVRIGFR